MSKLDAMSKPEDSLDNVGTLVAQYSSIARIDTPKPAAVLAQFAKDVERIVVPCIEALSVRSEAARQMLVDIVKEDARRAQIRNDALSKESGRIKALAAKIEGEAQETNREFKRQPPGSPERAKLNARLRLNLEELRLQERHLKSNQKTLSTSVDELERRIPSIEYAQSRVDVLHRQLRWMFYLTKSAGLSRVSRLAPLGVAFAFTVALDHLMPMADAIVHRVLPANYHTSVLILFFAIQIYFLTPLVDRLESKACWKSFNNSLGTVTSLLTEMRKMKKDLDDAALEMSRMLRDTTTSHKHTD